ncbi:hypothetical protein QTP86_005197 [Hemibagrus guttatus]|nr:hypothetical protein QTP86_005197 [Hemibagrus guttatus]
MKSGKAVGPDDIPVEVWKCLGEAAVEFLTSLFNRVLENLEKAYDRMPREELWYCMRKSGVAEKYVRVVQDLYERSKTVVRCAVVMDQLSEEVRQESPWTMMFADDIVICSESREQVEENLERWRFALERRGMKVSRSKTEYMCVNETEGSGTVRLQGEEVKKPLLNHRQHQRRLTWAKEKKNWTVAQWSKVLFSDESKFCISFGNQGPRVWRKGGEAHSPSCLKSNVKFPQSVMIWGAMSSAGVGPLCFLKTKVTAPAYQEILEHFMLPSADQLFEDADFIFQQDLAPAHTAKSTKSWLNDHGVGVLDWPANSPDLNPKENLWGIVKRKMRNKRPKNADELKATVKETWASIPPQQCHKLITSMPCRIEAVIKAKGATTKY